MHGAFADQVTHSIEAIAPGDLQSKFQLLFRSIHSFMVVAECSHSLFPLKRFVTFRVSMFRTR